MSSPLHSFVRFFVNLPWGIHDPQNLEISLAGSFDVMGS